jgi:2-polyprenyl-3-methyl-5-hydroxy-6-metoxy-1,4-benzoquinol methylase
MNEDVYIRTAISYRRHWWFKSRVLILDSIIKNLKLKKNIKILDYGSGVGSNITMLQKYGNVDALEPHIPTAKFLKKSFKIKIIKKLKIKYDLIFLTDVIEHIKNDKKKIKELLNILKKNGYLILTAPAFQFLFSKKDESLHHFRRYNKHNVLKLFNKKKIKIIKLSYFNFILFFPIAISVLFFKLLKINFIDPVEKTPIFFINYLMFKIFSFEKYLLKYMNFIFGISILLVVKKIRN